MDPTGRFQELVAIEAVMQVLARPGSAWQQAGQRAKLVTQSLSVLERRVAPFAAFLHEVDAGRETSVLIPEDGVQRRQQGDDIQQRLTRGFILQAFRQHLPSDCRETDFVAVRVKTDPPLTGPTPRGRRRTPLSHLDLRPELRDRVIAGRGHNEVRLGEERVLYGGFSVVPNQYGKRRKQIRVDHFETPKHQGSEDRLAARVPDHDRRRRLSGQRAGKG